jgi:hypothetical protein
MNRTTLIAGILSSCLLLNGCGFKTYHSQLASPPQDSAKYEQDMVECRDSANSPPPVSQSLAIGAFGVLGMAAVAADDNRAFKSKPELADECMKAKGYPVVSSN